ncbi:hypothetical protein [Peloplasma aerotolerans]|uniref:DUF3899 domain-containing protein n=1 Tax=Peloplasma aerotolerans TaxID=3044389 RepID=A0AAW6UA79_9MOLU|nr:hypothetical protein [Mariniplasma sp. M4Ah]MDI6453775.1 hypothetical protein [Mariniplasma sp. M4Ah]
MEIHKLSFNYLKDVDEFNEKLIIFVDNKKLESETLLIEAGLHEIKVEQYHILNNKYFLFGAILMAFLFFGYATESAYLLRRWGRFAVCKLIIDVQQDEKIKIRLYRQKEWFLGDRYQLSIKSDHEESIDSIEKRNIFTFLGTIILLVIPVGVIAGVVALFN